MSSPNQSTSPRFALPDGLATTDEHRHVGTAAEEWTFEWWSDDGSIAGVTQCRWEGRRNWVEYAWGLHRRGRPIMQIVQSAIRPREPMILKAPGFWAEFVCESAFDQWTIGNETHAVELDDVDEALGRAYGNVVPMASDLEWYATSAAERMTNGYRQEGVIVGDIETVEGVVAIKEIRSVRTHRWVSETTLPSVWEPAPVAHWPARLAFRFDSGRVHDLVLTPDGWAERGR